MPIKLVGICVTPIRNGHAMMSFYDFEFQSVAVVRWKLFIDAVKYLIVMTQAMADVYWTIQKSDSHIIESVDKRQLVNGILVSRIHYPR